jgi:UDP-N-acetylmuramyl pentapeptide phosphotransferase/UDP-N-acetylglucosamine-1-phosphate transferase
VLSALVGLVFAFWVMPFLLKFCRLKGFYDKPNERKVHKNAIPRLGGVIFMPAMLIGLLVYLFVGTNGFQGHFTLRTSSILMAIGAFLIYVIGIVDDLVSMKATHKFVIQLVAAAIMPFCWLHINNFYGLFGLYELPLWFSYPFTVFVILLVVNSINLIDGIDGLSSALCISILLVYVYLYMQMEYTMLYAAGAAALAGALLAFFYYNVFGNANKGSKTFMGDSGSLFLGYALAYLSIKYAIDNPLVIPHRDHALLLPYTLLIVPTFDVIRVAITRKLRGMAIFNPNKTHIHHKVMDAGFSMRQTLFIILGLFLLFCAINYTLYACCVDAMWIVLIDVLVFSLFIKVMNVMAKRRAQL